MNLVAFLKTRTNVGDLVMFHRHGWYIGCTMIDPEDMFLSCLDIKLLESYEVINHYYVALDWIDRPVLVVNV